MDQERIHLTERSSKNKNGRVFNLLLYSENESTMTKIRESRTNITKSRTYIN